MSEPRPEPEQDAIRRLLAEARHDEPLPDDVAQRLERVLDGLQAGSGRGAGAAGFVPTMVDVDFDGVPDLASDAAVVSLDARRQRRRAVARLLIAAAAVLAVGIGIGQMLGGQDDPSSTASQVQRQPRDGSAAGDADGSNSAIPSSSGSSQPAPSTVPAQPSTTAGLTYAQLEQQLPFALTSTDFDADVRAAVTASSDLAPGLQGDGPVTAALGEPLAGWDCATSGPAADVYGSGVLLPATYDDSPVVLALRPAAGDGIPVRVLACGSGDEVRRTILDAS